MDKHTTKDPSALNVAGEGVGGMAGAATGATIGLIGGPIGSIIGGIAGAVGGWWAGKTGTDSLEGDYTGKDDTTYRTQYEKSGDVRADRNFDQVRPAYQLGHVARLNPDYRGKSFDQIESDLRHGWTGDLNKNCGDWETCRGYVREAYEGSSGTQDSLYRESTTSTESRR